MCGQPGVRTLMKIIEKHLWSFMELRCAQTGVRRYACWSLGLSTSRSATPCFPLVCYFWEKCHICLYPEPIHWNSGTALMATAEWDCASPASRPASRRINVSSNVSPCEGVCPTHAEVPGDVPGQQSGSPSSRRNLDLPGFFLECSIVEHEWVRPAG